MGNSVTSGNMVVSTGTPTSTVSEGTILDKNMSVAQSQRKIVCYVCENVITNDTTHLRHFRAKGCGHVFCIECVPAAMIVYGIYNLAAAPIPGLCPVCFVQKAMKSKNYTRQSDASDASETNNVSDASETNNVSDASETNKPIQNTNEIRCVHDGPVIHIGDVRSI
jgi:hypothetical protein